MKINDILGQAKTVGIAGHIRPDGDCVGSCMALYNYLKTNRKDLNVRVFLEYVDPKFKLIAHTDEVETGKYDGTVFDLFIVLDTASLERLGTSVLFFQKAKKTFLIDHHKSNSGYADGNCIMPEVSSASEVLYGLLESKLFNREIAEPMYMGIAHDSGVFRFQSTTPKTMRIVADLMELGIDTNRILEETYYEKSYHQMLITAQIQSSSVVTMNGKCIYALCTSRMMAQYHIRVRDLDAVVASIRNVAGVEVAMFIYELEENHFKVSLRSKVYVDVSEIAMKFGGGGHIRAAGFDITGSLDDILKKILAEIQKVV